MAAATKKGTFSDDKKMSDPRDGGFFSIFKHAFFQVSTIILNREESEDSIFQIGSKLVAYSYFSG